MPSTRLTRRAALAGVGASTLASLTGCLGSVLTRFERDHDRDAPVGAVGAVDGPWPTYQRDFRNSGYAPDLSGPDESATLELLKATPTAFATTVSLGAGGALVGVSDGDGNAGGYYALPGTGGGPSWRNGYVHGKSSPTVAGDALFVSTAEYVAAYDARTGEHCWSVTGEGVGDTRNAPVLVGETVVAHGGDLVVGRNPATGAERWQYETDHGFGASVVAVGDAVYALVTDRDESATTAESSGDEDRFGVVSLDAATGEERWRRLDLPEPRSALVVDDGRVYYGAPDGEVYALSTGDGGTEWRASVGFDGDSVAGLAVTDERLHVESSTTGELAALGVETGEEAWSRSVVETNYRAPPVVAGGTRFVVGSRTLGALDETTGETRWSTSLGVEPVGPLSVSEDALYFVGEGRESGVYRVQ
ncbi:PQQ-binding-like beta-propeller repeat protein [Halobium salinum]|uniref:PQQ-binding-like beta-propeller repeat protein n=1 Tax=Halobium salinum TaxID=1364940 RepID=A0ABD5PFM9_9EURY|nr:PQQ-binding-like beta-propeller repeat protein [Halobium salinum]